MKFFRVALATDKEHAELNTDDRLLYPELEKLGIKATPAIWNDPVRWDNFDAVCLRNTWDYYLTPKDFLKWIDSLPVPLWNSKNTIRGNADKTYLLDLKAKGFAVVPSGKILYQDNAQIESYADSQGWKKAVVKPVISAGAWKTYSFSVEDETQKNWDFQIGEPLLIQPYLDEIETHGEVSLIFFGQTFSHGVLKRPKSGDFRVQAQYGGREIAFAPPPEAMELAKTLVDSHQPLLYARVDMVQVKDHWMLMELELIEPHLFLGTNPGAPRRFAEALKKLLENSD